MYNDFGSDNEFEDCISDLIQNEAVQSMETFKQHNETTCLEHSIAVSYRSYLLCKKIGLDYRSAARGGLLHDFFLYDWHIQKPKNRFHAFTHPETALKNADEKFLLNEKEKDIIENHMWPLTVRLPKSRESYIVSLVDKYCAMMELGYVSIDILADKAVRG
jgi:uncharacterized protein